jgi:hypothetical protein
MDESTKEIVRKCGLDGIIRLTKNEYPKKIPKQLTVFVVSPTTTKVGKYILPKILKFIDVRIKNQNGEFSTFPKLSFRHIFVGDVFKVSDRIDIFKLNKKDFQFSLSKIKNSNQLLKAIKRKYKRTRPGLNFSKVKVSKIEIRNLEFFNLPK